MGIAINNKLAHREATKYEGQGEHQDPAKRKKRFRILGAGSSPPGGSGSAKRRYPIVAPDPSPGQSSVAPPPDDE